MAGDEVKIDLGNVVITDPKGILNNTLNTPSDSGELGENELCTIEEARTACRVEGPGNDDIIYPIKLASEAYVLEAVGDKFLKDPRAKQAALLLIDIAYRPEDDAQGNMKGLVIALLRQMKTTV